MDAGEADGCSWLWLLELNTLSQSQLYRESLNHRPLDLAKITLTSTLHPRRRHRVIVNVGRWLPRPISTIQGITSAHHSAMFWSIFNKIHKAEEAYFK